MQCAGSMTTEPQANAQEFRHILVATDFSESSALAADMAVGLALKFGARLTLVHVHQPPIPWDGAGLNYPMVSLPDVREIVSKLLDEEHARLRARWPNTEAILVTGSPWEEIVHLAEQRGVDLVVMGTHGRRGISRALLGSVAERVLRMSKAPVLTLRAPEAPKKAA